MRVPMRHPADAPADVAVYGIPSDSGGPYRTGARFGPAAIRSQSVMLRPINPYRGNIDVLGCLNIVDAGDTPVIPGYLVETLGRIETFTTGLVEAGAIPLGLGGDHSVTLAELRSVARRHGPVALVHFDSHTDTWNSYFDNLPYSAGTPFRRAVEEGLLDPHRSIQIGMRGSLFKESDITQSRDLGFTVIGTDEALDLGPVEMARMVSAIASDHPVFLTFDMDFVDPASAPGVQTPEAGGPTAREALRFIRALKDLSIVGADVVETNPLYDGPGQVTSLLAATVAAEILALVASTRSPAPAP